MPNHGTNGRRRSGAYAVGYGRPPVATRFRPGHSGNPEGRPKGSKSAASIARETLERKAARSPLASDLEHFRPTPWTYRHPRWQAEAAVIPEGAPCPAWDGGSSWRWSVARRRGRSRRARSGRRIGVLMSVAADGPEGQARLQRS
jgi:hypothetical protein